MTELTAAPLFRLSRYGTIIAHGPDAKAFLQGQLSFDLDRLSPERVELASCNSPQGRVQAIVWLIERSDAIVLVLPETMVDATLARLRKYVLRAKVKLESGADRFVVCAAPDAVFDTPLQTHREIGPHSYVRWPGGSRVLVLAELSTSVDSQASVETEWHRGDIATGLPQIYPQTHEAFVAQMLNIDVLGGIGFEKGCYTGQEIIARTHYRGAIKRRMFRFRTSGPAPDPGARIVVGEQHAGDVVDAVTLADGSELLAVVTLSQIDGALRIQADDAILERLDLPYQL